MLRTASAADFPEQWTKLTQELRAKLDEAQRFNRENFRTAWNLAGADYAKWFPYGSGLPRQPFAAGEFSIAAKGDRVIDGIDPAGVITHRLSDKHNALLTSPRFKIETDSISVRAFGAGEPMVRVIVDNYPLPSNPIFPKAILEKDEPGWVRLDTAYRKGSWAYIEFGTRDDLTRPLSASKEKTKHETTGRSHFGVEQVVFHEGKDVPREEPLALLPLLDGPAPGSPPELAARYSRACTDAVTAWRDGQMTAAQCAFLDSLVRHGALPATLDELAAARPLVEEYRRLEAEVPVPQRVPGLLETVAYDAPFLPRGDHLKPGDAVPRAYLEVLGSKPYRATLSGRLELAREIASPQNPLTARVMANRIWHWLFGRGIVPTVDNFGRLGEKPTHPELLDYLAARLVENGWSIKDTIRFLVNSKTFQMSSEPSEKARRSDPANEWLSHMRVRRLEAEEIRDALLAVPGELGDAMYGPPAEPGAPRRSVYLQVRRTNLNPFLQVFDAPKPFTTLGRRDATNVPAQSLALLNSPFVIECAKKWARELVHDGSDCLETRVRRVFETAFARLPANDETGAARNYLAILANDRQVPADQVLANEPVWQDFAQSLFNLKEFIYLR
jgi:hypothetical protein